MDAASSHSRFARRAVLGFAFLAPFLTLFLAERHLLVALVPLVISHCLFLYATLLPNCQWLGPVVRSFKTAEPEVWLTIDDGPSPAHTIAILDLLDRFEARATFFVIGQQAEKYPHLITEILARGQEIANHTYTHPIKSFWAAGPARIGNEIDRCAEHLRARPDRPARLFRAPVGLKNLFVHPELERRGLALIGWSIRGLDTVRRDPLQVADKVANRAAPGAIIVLHEGHRLETDPEFNLRCVEATLSRLAEKGYRCVIPPLEQLRSQRAGR
ncbi:MAG TPA: polysaccharide deacetylase family protein [Chthoniobacterales bacterium]|jgi:peptidoglycan/xylan/chitin deacetylase (PgdA/CDA1 family)|nr:polysaccharide deacetylase family protein [Chthoniobacterales bacterium]